MKLEQLVAKEYLFCQIHPLDIRDFMDHRVQNSDLMEVLHRVGFT